MFMQKRVQEINNFFFTKSKLKKMESHDLKKFGKNAKRNNSVECQNFYGILQGGKKGGVHSTQHLKRFQSGCPLFPNRHMIRG